MATMHEAIALLKQAQTIYGTLHDQLSDMIEGQRLTECDCPDDYAALVDALTTCAALDHNITQFLRDAGVKELV